MLYRGTATVSYSSGTTTTTGCCDNYCECPNCGYRFGQIQVVVVDSDSSNFGLSNEDPMPVAEPVRWPKPRSDIAPRKFDIAFPILRSFHGREMRRHRQRHGGWFRNFHKVRD